MSLLVFVVGAGLGDVVVEQTAVAGWHAVVDVVTVRSMAAPAEGTIVHRAKHTPLLGYLVRQLAYGKTTAAYMEEGAA